MVSPPRSSASLAAYAFDASFLIWTAHGPCISCPSFASREGGTNAVYLSTVICGGAQSSLVAWFFAPHALLL